MKRPKTGVTQRVKTLGPQAKKWAVTYTANGRDATINVRAANREMAFLLARHSNIPKNAEMKEAVELRTTTSDW
jgi:hypothetical protein